MRLSYKRPRMYRGQYRRTRSRRLLPLAMVVAAVGMMVLYFNSGAAVMRNPMFMFFPVMMLVSVVGSLAYGARGGNRTAEINADRRDYLQYIDILDQSAVKNANAQHLALHWSHPEPGTLWALVGSRRMWERGPGDSDFCQVRLGLGASTPVHQAGGARSRPT